MKKNLTLFLLFLSIAVSGQDSDFESNSIKKNRIRKIEKWIEVLDSNGKNLSWNPYIYNFDRKGHLVKYTCLSFECGFYTDTRNNFVKSYYEFDSKNRIKSKKINDPIYTYFEQYTYTEDNKKVVKKFKCIHYNKPKKAKQHFFTKESILDSNYRETHVEETYLLNKQIRKFDFKYNAKGDVIQRITNNQFGIDTMNFEVEYNSMGQKSVSYFISSDGTIKIVRKKYFYAKNGYLIKEIDYSFNNPKTYHYKYFRKKLYAL